MAKTLKDKKILMTCGPTWVAIDPVRVISNRSTGRLGHCLTNSLKNEGAVVTLLEGPVTVPLETKPDRLIKFEFFDELDQCLLSEMKAPYDCLLHLAAVSDYKPKTKFRKKISSDQSALHLDLVPTEKLIYKIKKINPDIFLVGFKLEDRTKDEFQPDKLHDLFTKAGCDLVVLNFVDAKGYRGSVIDSKNSILAQSFNREELANQLTALLKGRL